MNTLAFLLSLVWLLRIFQNILSYVTLWYVKEYRWDRMVIHLRTDQGKRIYFLPSRRPPVTPKTIVLVVSLSAATMLAYLFLPFEPLVKTLMIDVVLFPATFLFVGFFQLPTLVYHQYVIFRAIRKLRERDDLLVIGITGSYGKTSTKEFLSTILSAKYSVLKTEASKNSRIAVAEVVLKNLKPSHRIFVVEMAAYRPGEIASMVRMVRPEIGIITAINPQHQDLFGSIETTMKAKYELFSGLVGKRIAIGNADNPYVRKMMGWARKDGCTVREYTTHPSSQTKGKQTLTASHIQTTPSSIRFTVTYQGRKVSVAAPLHGGHFAANILAAIAGAIASGMKLSAAAAAVRLVRHVAKVMEITKGPKGERLINDTFNNNPDAAIAAIAYLRQFAGRKFLVFQPMIELGSYTEKSHIDVGIAAGEVCQEIILTNSNFFAPFAKGVGSISSKKHVQILDADKASEYLKRRVTVKDTVLFKGKEAELVLKKYIGKENT